MRFTCSSFFILMCFQVIAQNQIGVNPPGIKWRTFSTEHGRFIFPAGLDSQALKVVSIIDHLRENDQSVNGNRITKKIPVILQNQSVLPNGFAIPAPWRMENYLVPPQNQFLGPVNWLDPLTIHEYRHAQQFWQANQGFTRLYQVLMGQTGWLVNSLFTQPLWYREGDAVAAETGFSRAGRGRLPAFHMETRALLMNDIRYNYEKMVGFSYRNFTPNPYRTGYYMTVKARKDIGDDIWVNVQNDAFKRKGFFQPFSRSMKKFTGFSSKQFYNETMDELDSLFRSEDIDSTNFKSNSITQPQKKYSSYRFPHFVSDSLIIAEKSSLDQIRTVVEINKEGNEKKLFHPGNFTGDHVLLRSNAGKITWSESRFDERWLHKDFAVVMIFDIDKGRKRQLTHRSRLFAPSISPNGSKIVAVQVTEQQVFNLVILDAENGEIESIIPNPDNNFLVHPVWKDQENLVVITQSACGNALKSVHIESGNYDMLVPCSDAVMLRPAVHQDLVFFDAAFEKIQNIYAVDLSTKVSYKITDAAFGAFDPAVAPDGNKLIFSEYNIDGYSIKEIPLDKNTWQPFIMQHNDSFFGIDYLEKHHIDITNLPFTDTFEIKKYNPFFRDLINIYGWFPLPNIPEYGVEFYSLNLMRTLQGTVGFLYNTNENAFRSYGRITYAALYPLFELEYGYNNRHTVRLPDTLDAVNTIDTSWFEHLYSAGIRLPFNFSRGIYTTNLELAPAFQLIDQVEGAMEKAVRFEILFNRNRSRARQHLNPRWGQNLEFRYQKLLEGAGEQLLAGMELYFPGISRTHTLNYRGGYQKQITVDAYQFPDLFRHARGYRPYPFDEQMVHSINYGFPLFYPDIPFGSIVFLQRIRANLFGDFAEGKVGIKNILQRSAGAEILFDMTVFRLAAVSLGPQFSYKFDDPEQTFRFNFLVLYFELL